MTKEEKDLYKSVLETWGLQGQIYMVIEESSELINALCKLKRGRVDLSEVITELADVQIMIEQMLVAFNCEEDFEKEKAFKLNRLKGLLKKVKREN
jgi:hypothetical protein